MLDLRNLSVAIRARYPPDGVSVPPQLNAGQSEGDIGDATESDVPPPRFIQPIDLSSGKAILSLQDMIDTTVALKSNLDLEVIQPSSQWPYGLFASTSGSLSQLPNDLQPQLSELHLEQNTAHVAQAISGLQREILLLRNDLNFELWLSRENSRHIGRLYQDRILMKTAEAERQGLVCFDFAI
jgi:hypothetical protein